MLDRTATPDNAWPTLPPLSDWMDTCTTVHLWTQIVGKIRLELSPWINHSWGSALYVTTSGLTTSPIPYGSDTFAIDFDFINHTLHITTTQATEQSFPLEPMSVADFYRKIMAALDALGIQVEIFARPVEVEVAIPFAQDTQHASYDADAMNRFWQALVQANRVFTEFRASYLGKVSPVHFFWGAFDLAVTRFSGRSAPKHPGGIPNCPDRVMEDAYSHEVSSAGFWAGTGLGEAAFYAYAYPAPEGFSTAAIEPAAAYYHEGLGEFVLPYEAVRTANDPNAALLSFLQTSYEAAANLANWDRAALEYKR
ncbi:DUF5996 family protein [Egbenema bharatensis]|uniref:DUF5996 family protein n=1 Tax=Egbenema bharatensis TaxID=3463334 RepID=UPI003A841ED6